MPTIDNNIQLIGTWVLGLSGTGMLLRAILTWMGRQGVISQGDTSQKDLLKNLTEEAERWRKIHEAEAESHEDSKKQLHATEALLAEIKMQNRMLRRLLINTGMTAEELDELLEISKPADLAKHK